MYNFLSSFIETKQKSEIMKPPCNGIIQNMDDNN